jgi:hypothetical protein
VTDRVSAKNLSKTINRRNTIYRANAGLRNAIIRRVNLHEFGPWGQCHSAITLNDALKRGRSFQAACKSSEARKHRVGTRNEVVKEAGENLVTNRQFQLNNRPERRPTQILNNLTRRKHG